MISLASENTESRIDIVSKPNGAMPTVTNGVRDVYQIEAPNNKMFRFNFARFVFNPKTQSGCIAILGRGVKSSFGFLWLVHLPRNDCSSMTLVGETYTSMRIGSASVAVLNGSESIDMLNTSSLAVDHKRDILYISGHYSQHAFSLARYDFNTQSFRFITLLDHLAHSFGSISCLPSGIILAVSIQKDCSFISIDPTSGRSKELDPKPTTGRGYGCINLSSTDSPFVLYGNTSDAYTTHCSSLFDWDSFHP